MKQSPLVHDVEAMITASPFSLVPLDPGLLLMTMPALGSRLLLLGAPGVGKSTFAAQLAAELLQSGRSCACLCADPGTPAFGLPGAISLGLWRKQHWHTLASEALCSLDAGRFRLPLIEAVRRLADRATSDVLLIDAPGVVRGVAGAELLLALSQVAKIDAVFCIARNPQKPPLLNELAALPAKILVAPAAGHAARPGKGTRARSRTRLWNDYLMQAPEHFVALDEIEIIGLPPPWDIGEAWRGRQVAFLDTRHQTLGFGEVLAKRPDGLTVRAPSLPPDTRVLLVRDVQRAKNGLLETAKPAHPATSWFTPPPDMLPRAAHGGDGGPRPLVRMGQVTATLVNGVFGDPLLHLRLRHRKRSLLFDLGETGRLPARIAHQVSDVFISHAHFDHIAGFLWLLRSRIGVTPPCRLFGPPGLTAHIAGLISGIHWDRIGSRGPSFEINELHGNRLLCQRLQAGDRNTHTQGAHTVQDGIVLQEAAFRVRAVTLEHGIPVLAFSFETPRTFNVRKERLKAGDLEPGPWLGVLKQKLYGHQPNARIELPDGRCMEVAALADQLLRVTPGQKLVYATDLADTPDNRLRLISLADQADTLFCEAAFTQSDALQAKRTGHLTARACGEIASAAQVAQLIPFHFSRRYERTPLQIYDEVHDTCSRTVLPGSARNPLSTPAS